jgi:hypothetical protein
MVELSNTKVKQKLKVKIGPSDVTIVNEITDFLVMIFPKDAGNKKVRVKSSVKSANLELDRLMPPANPNKPEDPIPNSELPEFFPELPDNVILNANVSLGRTVFKHLTLKKFNMDIAFANKVVSQNLKALLYDGRISQSFQGDFKNTKNGLFTFKMKTKNVQANDLITNGNNNLTGETALEANLRNLDNTVYGKMNLDMNLKTFGTPRTIVNNLSGVIYSNLSNGEIKESAFINSFNEGIAKVPGMNSYTLKEMTFRKFDSEYEIREGQLIVKKLELKDSPIGYALLNGPIGFDGKLDLSLKHLMTPKMSKPILSSQKKLTGGLSSSLKAKTGLDLALKAVPSTKKGEAIVYFNIGGSLAKPSFIPNLVKMQKEAMQENTASMDAPKALVTKNIKKVKEKAKKEIKKVTQKAKKVIKSQKKKVTKKAKEKAKKLLKGFGF